MLCFDEDENRLRVCTLRNVVCMYVHIDVGMHMMIQKCQLHVELVYVSRSSLIGDRDM